MSDQGRYRVLRKLADGGMAEIFLAVQRGAAGFERQVVLKRVRPSFADDQDFRDAFIDEAHIAMTLHHSNIAQVLDMGVSGGATFLVLELVDGWDVDKLRRRAQKAQLRLPPELALYVVVETARALAYAHSRTKNGASQGIVHRDVSPHNVLVSEQGEVKLTDFGIARARTRRAISLAGMVKGKVGFMSPEQAAAQPLDARSDLYSLGTTLYQLLTERLPFAGPNAMATMQLTQKGEFEPAESLVPIAPELAALLRRVMQRDPAARHQSAEEFVVEAERVQRTSLPYFGRTEMTQWLAQLAARDGEVPISRVGVEAVPEVSDADLVLVDAEPSRVLASPGPRPLPPAAEQFAAAAARSAASATPAGKPVVEEPPPLPTTVGPLPGEAQDAQPPPPPFSARFPPAPPPVVEPVPPAQPEGPAPLTDSKLFAPPPPVVPVPVEAVAREAGGGPSTPLGVSGGGPAGGDAPAPTRDAPAQTDDESRGAPASIAKSTSGSKPALEPVAAASKSTSGSKPSLEPVAEAASKSTSGSKPALEPVAAASKSTSGSKPALEPVAAASSKSTSGSKPALEPVAAVPSKSTSGSKPALEPVAAVPSKSTSGSKPALEPVAAAASKSTGGSKPALEPVAAASKSTCGSKPALEPVAAVPSKSTSGSKPALEPVAAASSKSTSGSKPALEPVAATPSKSTSGSKRSLAPVPTSGPRADTTDAPTSVMPVAPATTSPPTPLHDAALFAPPPGAMPPVAAVPPAAVAPQAPPPVQAAAPVVAAHPRSLLWLQWLAAPVTALLVIIGGKLFWHPGPAAPPPPEPPPIEAPVAKPPPARPTPPPTPPSPPQPTVFATPTPGATPGTLKLSVFRHEDLPETGDDVISVQVISTPPGASVFLLGKVWGETPISLKLRSGLTYDLELQKAGLPTLRGRVYLPHRGGQVIEGTLAAPTP